MGKYRGGEIFFDCGGSLVNRRFVVTAAHCGEHDVVRLGENNLDVGDYPDCDETGCAPPVQDIPIEKNILFGYNHSNHRNDLMLSKLKHEATLHEFVWPVCLPYGSLLTKDLMGAHVQIAGWGFIHRTEPTLATQLMYFSGPIVKIEDCNSLFKNKLDAEQQYCVGFPKNQSKDSCSGDSGGPMTKSELVKEHRQHFLLGVVSYGLKRCGDGPAAYTRIIYYLPQLLDAIQLHEGNPIS
ncbi:unnamed protein product [Callosobruchus maculatus]|uniref:Peptidase S1 domain-containing protein n=2 Tax=Callosobruchus maculatus TaxID=64391 RepID=A0A653CVT3_CALMS|nr:unnamed protein product [Callosobruchus maculatus]